MGIERKHWNKFVDLIASAVQIQKELQTGVILNVSSAYILKAATD